MCPYCVYKDICKLTEIEMNRTAADSICHHFKPIPPYPATISEETFLV